LKRQVEASEVCEECGVSVDRTGYHRGSAAKELNEIKKQRARKHHRSWQTYNSTKKDTETREFLGCTALDDRF
jgi:hypothetical protein